MKNFTYYKPASAEAAVALLDKAWGTSELLAGGTDLLARQKDYIAQPAKVVSLNGIKDFDKIASEGKPLQITIGAGARLAALASDTALKTHCPGLAQAAGQIAGPQIRNMGTLGGNLCQRNRCWYFRDEHTDCLLKGGDRCFALDGDNRYHAVFTKGHPCVIVSPTSLGPVLIALGAKATVLGPKGQRTVELSKFFHAPKSPDEREHNLAPNELLLSVSFQVPQGLKSASYEVLHRQSNEWPLVQAAVAFTGDGGKAKDVKIVLGHVAPTPLVAAAAARSLEGKAVTEETAQAAGEAAAEGAVPLKQNGYKVKLIAVAVKRALLTAAGAKKYWAV
jgi:xanthine dehydrogenase YagS FAD-binding subunit